MLSSFQSLRLSSQPRQKTIPFGVFVAATTALVPAMLLAGCGSGGTPSPPIIGNPTTTYLSRATENTVSDDAKVLATRVATSAFVSLDVARAYDADLAKIRAAYPAVLDVHARSAFTPKDLLVTIKQSTPWLAKWKASAALPDDVTSSDLTTGESKLDALLKKYDATRTGTTSDFEDEGVYFQLEFGQSLNMAAVADEFAGASANIVNVGPNDYIGDGDDVTVSTVKSGDNNATVYTFTQGYGDCPAGCTGRYVHTYTIAASGTITEKIEGTPPPAGEASSTSSTSSGTNGVDGGSRATRLSRIKRGNASGR